MKVIGITGLIASGKSEVTSYLRQKGYNVISADEVSHEISEPGRPGYDAIINAFGKEYLNAEGGIDRKKLGDRVFSNKTDLNLLNSVMWPIIRVEVKNRASAYELSFLEAALLIEADMADETDGLWIVEADRGARVSRLIKRNAYTPEEAEIRVAAQDDAGLKNAKALAVIKNNGTLEELFKQVDEALSKI